jgi:hypothetical protein
MLKCTRQIVMTACTNARTVTSHSFVSQNEVRAAMGINLYNNCQTEIYANITITIVEVIHNVSDIRFCLRLHVELTHLSPIDR